MNRRELVLSALSGVMSGVLSTPFALYSQSRCPRPRLTLFLFLRGGLDGQAAFPILPPSVRSNNSHAYDYLRRVRPNLMLKQAPDAETPYAENEVIPVAANSQLGFHPAWERLFRAQNLHAQIKPERVSCDNVHSRGGRSLKDFIAFRVIKGVGMMHFYQSNVPLGRIAISKSHWDMIQTALAAMRNYGANGGFLGRAVYPADAACAGSQAEKLRLLGFGSFSQRELATNVDHAIVLNSGYSEMTIPSFETHLPLPYRGCASYNAAGVFTSAGNNGNHTHIKNLIDSLKSTYRDAEGLRKHVLEMMSLASSTSNLMDQINRVNLTIPNVSSSLADRFGAHSYAWENNRWNRRVVTNQITDHFINITKFFLSNAQGLDSVDKVVALSVGGFDTHAYQNSGLPALISSIAGGLHGMFRTILELRPDLYDCLTVVTLSEFGRSLRQDNGTFHATGSDHGWRCHYAIMSGRSNPVDNNSLDMEFGPELTTTDDSRFRDHVDSILNRISVDYAADSSVSHLNVDPRHIPNCPSTNLRLDISFKC